MRVFHILSIGFLLLLPVVVGGQTPVSVPPQVPAEERARIDRVASGAAVTTRVQAEPFVARREVFEYLLEHPAFASHVARALDLSKLKIWRTEEGLFLDEGWGTTGLFSIIHAGDGERIIYARGQHLTRPLPAIHGEAVVLINYRYTAAAPPGRELVNASVTGFVKLDSRILSSALKLVSGIAQKKADREAKGLVKLFAKVSRAVDEAPAAVYAKLRERPDTPSRELEEFKTLLDLR